MYESVTAQTLASFLSIAEAGPWTVVRGTWIDKARNSIMEEFQEDLLLMLDADMVFNPADVGRLLNALRANPECGAISGHYILRNGSGMPACDWRHPEDPAGWLSETDRREKAERHTRDRDLAYVDSFGGGFLAVTQEAKQKVGHPWFKTLYQDNGEFLGEDTFFCQRLQEEGYKPAVHFGIPVGHCGMTVYRPGGGKE